MEQITISRKLIDDLIKQNKEDIERFREDLKEAIEHEWRWSEERCRAIIKSRLLAIEDLKSLLPKNK